MDEQFKRGWQRRTLIRRLGREAEPDLGLVAAELDLSRDFVVDFNYDNRQEIEATRADFALDPNDPFAGVWAKHRDLRVEEYLTEVRTINRVLAKLEAEGRQEEDVYDRFFRMKVTCLEIIAKELGQSKPTIDASGGVSFVINGIDLGALT